MEHEHQASLTARAVKQVLPDRAIVTKDARVMLNTATSMFTLYLTAIAHEASIKGKRSTITLKDVLTALRETEMEQFIEPIERCLEETKAADARKRAAKEAEKTNTGDEPSAHEPSATTADDGLTANEEATSRAAEETEGPMETDADLDDERTAAEEEEEEEEGEEEKGDEKDDERDENGFREEAKVVAAGVDEDEDMTSATIGDTEVLEDAMDAAEAMDVDERSRQDADDATVARIATPRSPSATTDNQVQATE